MGFFYDLQLHPLTCNIFGGKNQKFDKISLVDIRVEWPIYQRNIQSFRELFQGFHWYQLPTVYPHKAI